MTRLSSFALVLASLLAALSAPARAAAQSDFSVGPTTPTRNWYAGGGLGASFGLEGGSALFVLNEEVGYQLDPMMLGGGVDLALRFGLDLSQQLGDFYLFTFGARAAASFGLWSNGDMAVRVAPSLVLGGGLIVVDEVCTVFGCFGGGTEGAFHVQFATQAELDLLEGMLTLYFRPVSISGYVRDGGTSRWDMLAGAYVHF